MTKKILIADDEEEIIQLLKTALEPSGYSVVSTITGTRLYNLVQKEKPDLLILDILLPGLDGYSLQLELSQDQNTSSLPVIIITALPAARSLFDGFNQVRHFFSKPFDTMEVLNKIREIIGQ